MGANPILTAGKSIVFFDANCLLCNRFVKILLKFDRQKFYYSGFDSEVAKSILSDRLRHEPQTIVFYQDDDSLVKSKAVFKIIRELSFPWPILGVFGILPTSLTDMIYNWVARHRLAWFGRSETCFIPTTEQKSRFFE
jgi:predicted DCC family thiol-disulfide oxidoreductase YuxK